MQDKRPVIVCIPDEPNYVGGGEIVLEQVAGLLRASYRFIFLCKRSSVFSVRLKAAGYCVRELPALWFGKGLKMAVNPFLLAWAWVFVARERVVGVYCNTASANRLASRLAALCRVPVIVHVHDLMASISKDRFLLKRAAAVLTNSEATRSTIGSGVAAEVVRFGVAVSGVERSGRTLKHEFGVENRPAVVCAATLTPKKGWREFVQAAATIKKEVPDVVFFVVGAAKPQEGGFEEELRTMVASSGLTDAFFFVGFRSDMQTVYAAADVFLFPTHFEAFGRVIIEAFAASVPVISTRSGGPAEIIEDGVSGFLVEVGDVAAMAKRTVLVLTDRKVREVIISGVRERFEKCYSEAAFSARMHELFKKNFGV
jgi:glycosyltransferase involved in cell wall biosynthesis